MQLETSLLMEQLMLTELVENKTETVAVVVLEVPFGLLQITF